MPKDAHFATGIVKHLDKIQTGQAGQDFYAYTWGKQSFHKDYLGMAIFADNNLQPTAIEDKETHAFIFKQATKEVRYAFMAAWEKGNSQIKNEADFKKLVEVYAN